jgi:methionine aminopeptidase
MVTKSGFHTLKSGKLVMLSDTGFSNKQLALRWLEHFAEHATPHNGSSRVILLDSHVSHTSDDFVIAAEEHDIIVYAFPSHLTHILQPLDVGIFQPYKH